MRYYSCVRFYWSCFKSCRVMNQSETLCENPLLKAKTLWVIYCPPRPTRWLVVIGVLSISECMDDDHVCNSSRGCMIASLDLFGTRLITNPPGDMNHSKLHADDFYEVWSSYSVLLETEWENFFNVDVSNQYTICTTYANSVVRDRVHRLSPHSQHEDMALCLEPHEEKRFEDICTYTKDMWIYKWLLIYMSSRVSCATGNG